MQVYIIQNVKPEKANKLVNMIYYNFIELTKYPELKHNKKELLRLITSKDMKLILILINKKIVSYLIGENMELNDGRRVFYISYIFTCKKFRGQGLATKLMNYIEKYAKKFNFDGIMLTSDQDDEYIDNFYKLRGYMPDMILRQYKKHDVMYKTA